MTLESEQKWLSEFREKFKPGTKVRASGFGDGIITRRSNSRWSNTVWCRFRMDHLNKGMPGTFEWPVNADTLEIL